LTQVVAGAGDETVVEYQCLTFLVTGTLTGNVVYTFPAGVGGFWLINALGLQLNGFSCSFASATGGGTAVSVQSGAQSLIYCDGTNVRTNTLGNFNSVFQAPAAGGTFSPAQAGSLIEIPGATATYALPSPSITPPLTFTIWAETAVQNITTPAGILTGPGGNGTASLPLPAGAVGVFTSDGANWVVTLPISPAGVTNNRPMPVITDANAAPLGWAQYAATAANIPNANAGVLETISSDGNATPDATNVINQFAYNAVAASPPWFRRNIQAAGWTAWSQLALATGNPANTFLVANATPGTQQAVPITQADGRYARIAGSSTQPFSTGNLGVTGTLNVSGNASIGGALGVTGSINTNGSLGVVGNISTNGGIFLNVATASIEFGSDLSRITGDNSGNLNIVTGSESFGFTFQSDGRLTIGNGAVGGNQAMRYAEVTGYTAIGSVTIFDQNNAGFPVGGLIAGGSIGGLPGTWRCMGQSSFIVGSTTVFIGIFTRVS
jgi:hypothetical protein